MGTTAVAASTAWPLKAETLTSDAPVFPLELHEWTRNGETFSFVHHTVRGGEMGSKNYCIASRAKGCGGMAVQKRYLTSVLMRDLEIKSAQVQSQV